MKTSYCTVTVPVRKKSNVIYLDDWKAECGLEPAPAPAVPAPRPRRRAHRTDLSTVLELLATLSVVGVMAALILRMLLF